MPRPLVLVVFIILMVLSGRQALQEESLPVFSLPKGGGLWVELGVGFSQPGVHQFSDGSTLADVIKLTAIARRCAEGDELGSDRLLVAGESLSLDCSDKKVAHLQQGWMTAWQRMSLGVPLHPDRMTRDDWTALPGIGETLAKRIENDRQDNGDFGSLLTLERVSGVGPKRLEAWSGYFY